MIRHALASLFLVTLASCADKTPAPLPSELAPEDVRSGSEFLTAETKALQDDDFANPGYLWVDQGGDLFRETSSDAPSCASCHDDGLKGAAATYPKIDADSGELINLEGQINLCRTRHQGLEPLDYESDALLSLTAFVAEQSKGVPLSVDITGDAAPHYENGKAYFFRKRGQFNFSCAQCHNDHWGRKLRGDTISQGHLTGFPGYRMEWESFGSSHRRLRDCDMGVRAEPLPFGDQTYIDVELYLAHRASGLALESPGVRR